MFGERDLGDLWRGLLKKTPRTFLAGALLVSGGVASPGVAEAQSLLRLISACAEDGPVLGVIATNIPLGPEGVRVLIRDQNSEHGVSQTFTNEESRRVNIDFAVAGPEILSSSNYRVDVYVGDSPVSYLSNTIITLPCRTTENFPTI